MLHLPMLMHPKDFLEYEFTSEVDKKLVCSVCLEVSEAPEQEVYCGQLFCIECLEKVEGTAIAF